MSLHNYLITEGITTARRDAVGGIEGFCQQVPEQIRDLIELTNKRGINIMEIGFNAGHSSEVFLATNPSSSVTSFDIGTHYYLGVAKGFIDKQFSGRHTLIIGDSTISVPTFIKKYHTVFDFIFIDGGHSYEVALSDVSNCFHLADSNTIVAIDDVMFNEAYSNSATVGPTKAWDEFVKTGRIVEIGRKEYTSTGRGMVWGKYLK